MPDTASQAELLRSLGRLARGLSALFWGLPLVLLVFLLIWVQTTTRQPTPLSELFDQFGIVLPLSVTALLVYGLWQLGDFQKQERIWIQALDRAKMLALINLGLSPFLFFWNRMPEVAFFALAVLLLAVVSLLFLVSLNQVLHRLTAMLPDEALRQETRLFSAWNCGLLLTLLVGAVVYFALWQIRAGSLPVLFIQLWLVLERHAHWLSLFLLMAPVAMTMALLWKIKEVILASVFSPAR